MTVNANIWDAVDYINSFRPGDTQRLVLLDNVVENGRGICTVRVYTNRFTTRDTVGALLTLVSGVFGTGPHASQTEDKLQVYEWQLCSTRWFRIIGKQGIGTFVQLIDKGDPL